jgi:broad specificity phosphatase PhoE
LFLYNLSFTTSKDFGRLSNLSIHDAFNLIKSEDGSWEDYGESKETLSSRVVSFFQEIVGKHLPSANAIDSIDNPKETIHICVVTHGGVINLLVKEHLIMKLGFFVKDYKSIQHKPKNSSITKVVLRRMDEEDEKENEGEGRSKELKVEGEVQLWSDVSHWSKLGKKTRGDTAIDDYVH